jgi:hypothetical protein
MNTAQVREILDQLDAIYAECPEELLYNVKWRLGEAIEDCVEQCDPDPASLSLVEQLAPGLPAKIKRIIELYAQARYLQDSLKDCVVSVILE